jgi:hypothetical protein
MDKEKVIIKSEEKEECFTCTEPYNKISHRKVLCCYCSFSSCHKCVQRYIMFQIQDPHCMNCKKVWKREFIDENLSRQFITTELKTHRENILFEKEKNLLPETQYNVKLLQTQQELENEMVQIESEIEQLRKRYEEIERKKNEINPYQLFPRKVIPKLRIPCPIELCRGFVEESLSSTSNTLRCGICDITLCIHCRERYTIEHKCNNDTIRTIKLVEKETKRCPSCMVPIFKINGCDQMWCTSCHIAFDWKTGEQVRGIIHNPHYHEYIEQHGIENIRLRQQQSYHRFEFMETERIVRVLESLHVPEVLLYQLIEVYRYMIHYYEVDLQRLPSRFDQVINVDLRIQYLQHQLSEDEFKHKIQRRQKDIEKKIEYKDIGETYVEIMNDIFISFITTYDLERLMSEIKHITLTTQEAIQNLNKRYQSNMQLVRTLL